MQPSGLIAKIFVVFVTSLRTAVKVALADVCNYSQRPHKNRRFTVSFRPWTKLSTSKRFVKQRKVNTAVVLILLLLVYVIIILLSYTAKESLWLWRPAFEYTIKYIIYKHKHLHALLGVCDGSLPPSLHRQRRPRWLARNRRKTLKTLHLYSIISIVSEGERKVERRKKNFYPVNAVRIKMSLT